MNFERLRALVLERAVQGNLVSQLESEPETAQLGDAPQQFPIEIPEKWKWVKLSELATEMADGPFGSNLKKEHYTLNREARIIQLSNIGEHGWRNENVKYTTFKHAETISRSKVNSGDIVIAKMMPAGRAIIVPPIEKTFVLSSDAVKVVVNNKYCLTKYLNFAINSNVFKNQVYSNVQGTTRIRTSVTKLKNYYIPLPSLDEQIRIVAKLEEAFDEIDRAEKAYEELQTLAGVLRGQILQEAIQGKLIPQLDSEEEVQQIGDAPKEVPFAIPEKWKWVTLSELVPKIVDCPHSTPKYSSEETKFLAIDTNCITPVGVIKSWRYVTEEIYKKRVCRLEPQKDDIIYTREGSIGRAARIPDGARVCMGQRVMLIRPGTHLEPSYLQWYLMSHCALSHLTAKQRGIGVKHINVADVKKLPIPVPPVLEQRRIVAKIEELFQEVEKISR